MLFIDKIIINVVGGKGGNGNKSYLYIKKKHKKIPNGGNGGNGGNIFFITDININNFKNLKNKKYIKGFSGYNGKKNKMKGKNGNDYIFKIPIGTKITNIYNKKTIFLKKKNEKILIAKGGKGGKGNFYLKKKKDLNKYLLGLKGDNFYLLLELILIADLAIIGTPNVGKSSLLYNITKKKVKISYYPFTTLSPNKKNFFYKKKNLSIIEIPSINNNNKYYKSLGIKFLKHLYFCKLILHVIDISNILYYKDIFLLLKLIKKYPYYFNNKNYWLIINKIDLINKNILKININNIMNKYKIYYKKIFIISINYKNINNLIKKIYEFIYLK